MRLWDWESSDDGILAFRDSKSVKVEMVVGAVIIGLSAVAALRMSETAAGVVLAVGLAAQGLLYLSRRRFTVKDGAIRVEAQSLLTLGRWREVSRTELDDVETLVSFGAGLAVLMVGGGARVIFRGKLPSGRRDALRDNLAAEIGVDTQTWTWTELMRHGPR